MEKTLTQYLSDIQCEFKERNYGKALEIIDEALKHYPDSYELFEKQGSSFYFMQEYDKAFSSIERVMTFLPDEIAPYFKRGRWKFELGRHVDAINDFTKVINSLDEYFLEAAYYYRAMSYLYRQQYDKALNDCSHVNDDMFLGPELLRKEEIVFRAKNRL